MQGSSQSQQVDPAEGVGEGGEGGAAESGDSEAAAGGASSAGASAEGPADGDAGSAGAAPGGDAAAGGAAAGASGSSGEPGGSGNSGGAGPSTPSAPAAPSAPTPAPAPAPATITVSVYVDSSKAASAGYPSCMASTSVSLREGATAYDALCASGVSVSGSSSYVTAINGLAEKQVSAGSGWMYSVNGSTPMVPAGSYVLSSGDSVRWYYVV
ncbi:MULTISPECIES: DUF4430 domain-containing protein [unclassified Adlercreutzia]|uniref:DUF4430 domain-containing protein n=1 Tax=unclassified Adlercreutzia TaxID=2636013 RepID=UPI0013E9E3A7|nr:MULTISPECIES: DUF4430 domain-containing protein [unclassified Adlercreutzia]